MKLSVQTTREVSTDSLNIFCDPPLIFKSRGFIAPGLFNEISEWEKKGHDEKLAVGYISRLFVSFSQNGETFPLTTKEDAMALREAIEESNPGGADGFLSTLIEAYLNEHYRFFRNRLAVSESSLPVSSNGKVKEPTP